MYLQGSSLWGKACQRMKQADSWRTYKDGFYFIRRETYSLIPSGLGTPPRVAGWIKRREYWVDAGELVLFLPAGIFSSRW
jgi:hypothetical protein